MNERGVEPAQAAFAWANLLQLHRDHGRPYLEFLRSASLSCGLYVLPAGSTDEQSPHTQDEVYVVAAGGSLFTAGAETREVRAGDVLFVASGVPHRFHDISEDLRLVVVFAPPEVARTGAGDPIGASAPTTGETGTSRG